MVDIDIKQYEEKIRKLKLEIDTFKPFSSVQLKNLQNWFKISFTAHSNAIEWNSFTQEEVKVLIEDGITVWWKTIRELRETQNLAELTNIIWVFFEKDFILDEKFLLELHKNLLTWIEEQNLWKYRETQVYVSWSDDTFPKSKEVPWLMDTLIDFANWEQENILEKIAKIHYDFVKIHPFVDGNGRIARLLMNLYFVKNGFLPIIFPVVTRLEYIRSLWTKQGFEEFYKYFLWQTHENLNDYLRFFRD
ncbi:MAG: Fic [uncultured bacterium (gcode 4)]|uniref:Fic n=1 Tax=uncultured bacterium (gcode 4) TaxID=1234023 RepID=K1Z3Y5_9BACT|nr:MAG: Fic [uncultured bacterium (gcode 4)]